MTQSILRSITLFLCGTILLFYVFVQLKPAGTPCRQASNSCDLPEFCTGTNPHCPANVYLHDGHACHSMDGYCYNGICQTHEQQCITLWGPGWYRNSLNVNVCLVALFICIMWQECEWGYLMILSSANGPRLECRHLCLVKHMLVEFEEALVTSHETECHRQGEGSYYILMKDCVFSGVYW